MIRFTKDRIGRFLSVFCSNKYLFVFVWIILAIAIVSACFKCRIFNVYKNITSDFKIVAQSPDNFIKGLSYSYFDPDSKNPAFTLKFDTFSVVNAKAGIFRTALTKVIYINNLKIQDYHYKKQQTSLSSDPALKNSIKKIAAKRSKLPINKGPKVQRPRYKKQRTSSSSDSVLKNLIKNIAAKTGQLPIDIDISNVSKAEIKGFEYQFFQDSDKKLNISSRHAFVSHRWPIVTLRGNVTITAEDGTVLKSNHVRWNTKKKHFTIESVYALKNADRILTGKEICLDYKLNQFSKNKQSIKPEEKILCIAKR